MHVHGGRGPDPALWNAFLQWHATQATGGATPAASTGSLGTRVDTWEPHSGHSSRSRWDRSSVWSTAAGVARDPQAGAAPVTGQQFVVSRGTSRVAGLSAATVGAAVITAVSEPLGLTTADVSARLDAGQSLNDVAFVTDTSHDDLISAIHEALPDLNDPDLSAAAAERIAATPGHVTAQTLTLLADAAGPGHRQAVTVALTHTAQALSLGTADLMTQLSAGASLAQLAGSQGVSHDDLITAIRSDLPARTPGWSDPQALAEAVAATTSSRGPVTTVPPAATTPTTSPPAPTGPGQQFHVDPGTGPHPVTLSLTNTADILSLSTGALMTQLSQGASLSGLADAQGISHDDLILTIQSDLPVQTPGWNDPQALAEAVAASTDSTTIGGTTPTPPLTPTPPATPPGQTFHVDPGTGPAPITITLSNTADLLSLSTGSLMTQLSQGASLSGLADAQGISHDDLITTIQSDLPSQTPGWDDPQTLAEAVAASTDSTTATSSPPSTPTTPAMQTFSVDPGTGAQGVSVVLSNTADLLSLTPADLMAQLSQGTSLSDLADARSVSYEDLVNTIMSDLPDQTPGWADPQSLAQAVATSTDSSSR